MENKDNQPIDDLFVEKDEQKVPENLRERQDRSNYFNDFGGGTNARSSHALSQNESQTQSERTTQGDDQNQSERKGQDFLPNDYAPEQNEYFDNSQKANFDVNAGFQNGNKTSDTNKYFALGVVSMIFGITSIFSSILMGITIVLAIMGLVLAIVRMSVKADGFSIAGLIASTIGFLLNALFLMVFIFIAINPTESAVVLQTALLL
ncbi:MAG: DUF4190 domain-containing protein [Clostridia bacterium]|nr:DUF4190 domain-containing protein [Clostridia bacterium]